MSMFSMIAGAGKEAQMQLIKKLFTKGNFKSVLIEVDKDGNPEIQPFDYSLTEKYNKVLAEKDAAIESLKQQIFTLIDNK